MSNDSNHGKHPLPGTWVWSTLGEIASPQRMRVDPQAHPDLPFIGMEDIEPQTMRLLRTRPASEMKSSAEFFRPNDVLYGSLRPYLNKVYCPDFEGLCSAEFIVFRRVPHLESKYLQYFLNQMKFVSFINRQNTGDRPRVKFAQMAGYPFPLAPTDDQRRVVAEIETQFTRLEATVAGLKRVQANLERYKAAVLKAACEGRLVPQDPDDEPAEKLLERILAERRRQWEEQEWQKHIERAQKKTAQAKRKAAGRPHRIRDLEAAEWQELPETEYAKYLPKNEKWKEKYEEPERPDTAGLPKLPSGWMYATPEHLASPEKYSLGIGPFGSNLKVADYREHGIPLVFVRDIRSENFGGPDTRFVSLEKADELHAHVAFPGDILVTKMGDPPGDAAIYPQHRPPAVITADCIKWRLSAALPDARFFVQIFGSRLVSSQILQQTRGVAQRKVSLARFKTIAVPVPPTAEQQRIALEIERRLTLARNISCSVSDSLNRAKRMRQAILQKAFSGHLVPGAQTSPVASSTRERDGSVVVEDQVGQPRL